MAGDRVWWVSALQWATWGIAMVLVMGWIARSRERRRANAQPGELRYPVSTAVLGVTGFLFFIGLPVAISVFGKGLLDAWIYGLFAMIASPAAYMIVDWAMTRYYVNDEGIHWKTPLSGHGFAPWRELRALRFSKSMKWFLLETSTGHTVRVSAMLKGLPEFARLAVTRVSPDVIEAETLDILKRASIGRLPSVWG